MSARVQEIRERLSCGSVDEIALHSRCDLAYLLVELDRVRHAADIAIEAAQAHERGHTSTAERLGRIAERALLPDQRAALAEGRPVNLGPRRRAGDRV